MFIVFITYKKPIETIDHFLSEHRAYLDLGYQKNYFIASGPQNPRTGGIILSQLESRDHLMEIIKQDPFYKHELATYELIEFSPVKYHHDFAPFVKKETTV